MKCAARVKSRTGKRFSPMVQCSRNAYPGFYVCRQHGAKTPEEMNADYLAEITLKKGEELRAAPIAKAEAETAAYSVAQEKATRLTRMAPQLLHLVEELLAADASDLDDTQEEHLLDRAHDLVAFIKNKCPAEDCPGVYDHFECPQCGGVHCLGH